MRRLLACLTALVLAWAAPRLEVVLLAAVPTLEASPNAVASAGASTVNVNSGAVLHDGDTVVLFALQIGAGSRTYTPTTSTGTATWTAGPATAANASLGLCKAWYSTNVTTSGGTIAVDIGQSSTSVAYYGVLVGIHGTGLTLADSDDVDDTASPYDFDAVFDTSGGNIFGIIGAAANGSMVTISSEIANPATWTRLNIFAGATTVSAAYVSNGGNLTADSLQWASSTTRRIWECGLVFQGAASTGRPGGFGSLFKL